MRFNAFFKVAAVHPARHGQCASDRLCGDGNDAASPLDGLCESWQLAEVDLFLREGSGLDVLRSIQRRLPHQRVAVLTNTRSQRCANARWDSALPFFFDKSTELEPFFNWCNRIRMVHPASGAAHRITQLRLPSRPARSFRVDAAFTHDPVQINWYR
jgi:hypothetical protein